jgi:glyceraldehyde 3-phosphate dehydrogenase
MQKLKVAINGFGRIGRLATRIILTKYPELNLVAVNDLTSAENLSYLLAHDTTYRTFSKKVEVKNGSLWIDGNKEIQVLSEANPADLPWKSLGVDVVLECSGRFLTKELAMGHIQAGAKKVILSAPAKSDDIKTVVLGGNLGFTDNISDEIVSNASCTTNCVVPVLKILQDQFEIKHAVGLTAHAYTATQVLQDGPTKKDFRDGRAAAQNMIPSATGAAKAVELVLPELKGLVSLSSLRVPVICGSMVFLTCNLGKPTTKDVLGEIFLKASQGELKSLLEFSTDQLVSSDIIGNSHSCILDWGGSEVLADGQIVKLVLWYDNEWGYANRLVDLLDLIQF